MPQQLNEFPAPPTTVPFASGDITEESVLEPFPSSSHRTLSFGASARSPPFGITPPQSSHGLYSRATSSVDISQSAPLSPRASTIRLGLSSPPQRPVTIYSAPLKSAKHAPRELPKSTMLAPDAVLEKPWLGTRDPASIIMYMLTYGCMIIGLAAGAFKCYSDWNSVHLLHDNQLCPVLSEDFANGDQGLFGENGVFFREVEMGGFGNGQFEMTTSSSNNSFVSNGRLYILPTLTADIISQDALLDGSVYNITDCTYNITKGVSYTSPSQSSSSTEVESDDFDSDAYYRACSAVSNTTAGTMINPVRSARISTRRSASIRYGKIEVRAKIPTGDWLWPAIWMMPVDSAYGEWPLSGEIDIMEARGNGLDYPKQGRNYVRGSLNWGPNSWLNAVFKTYGWWFARRGAYSDDFHTYSLEWTDKFIRIYVDSRLHHLLDLNLGKQSFWERGDFPPVVQNGTESVVLENPWINGTAAAPFDQKFYLIMNVAIGGTNGWFPDGDEKPWLNGAKTAMRDFWQARDKWYPTWPENVEDRALVVDSIKMWQLC